MKGSSHLCHLLIQEEDIPDDSSDEHRSSRERGHYCERGRPPGEPRYQSRGRQPPRREESQGTGRPPDGGRPPGGGGPPDGGGPHDDGGPTDGNGGPPHHPNRIGPPGPRGPPGLVRPVVIQQPQVVLDTTALENTFNNMGQSMLQLARAQDQTNHHLQQHIQQGQLNMQAHAGALH